MKTTNKLPYIIGGIFIVILIIFLIVNSTGNKKQPTASNIPLTTSAVNTTPSTKPENVVPGLYENPIKNPSTAIGFSILSAKAENNTDEAGKPTSDHLEMTLKNTSSKDLSDFEVYYTITDTVTQKKEGYYAKLTGFTLKSNQTQTIHFDNKQTENHFAANTNSLYYTSANKLLFDVIVSTPGYKVQTIQVTKDAGGAEIKD